MTEVRTRVCVHGLLNFRGRAYVHIYIYSYLYIAPFVTYLMRKGKREETSHAIFATIPHTRNNRRELGPRTRTPAWKVLQPAFSRRQPFKLRNYVITGGVLFASDLCACYIARLYLFHALRMFGRAPMVMPWKAAFNEYIRANYTRMSEGWVVSSKRRTLGRRRRAFFFFLCGCLNYRRFRRNYRAIYNPRILKDFRPCVTRLCARNVTVVIEVSAHRTHFCYIAFVLNISRGYNP